MPKLGLSTGLTRSGLTTPGIVTSDLVLKHKYDAGSVVPVSDGACKFNGTSDYIAIGAKPVDTADATYCFWANSTVTGVNDGVFGHTGELVCSFNFNHSSDRPILYLKNDKYQYWVDTPAQDDGKWHHWAVVVDVDDMQNGTKLYVDGVLQTQSTRDETGTATSYGNLEIGRADSSNEYEGYLCNFGVWSSLLTQPQIKSIKWKNYANLTSSETTNLVSWWNLDSSVTAGATTLTQDSHGSNHGTLL